MNTTNVYKKAGQNKLRFDSSKGELTVEDLWTASLAYLDRIAVAVDKQIQEEGVKSFIGRTSKSSTENKLRLDILKDVIETKVNENEAKKTKDEKKAQAEFLQGLLVEKEMDALKNMPVEEIKKKLAELA